MTEAEGPGTRSRPITNILQCTGSLLIVYVAQRSGAQVNGAVRMSHESQRTGANCVAGLLLKRRGGLPVLATGGEALVVAIVGAEVEMRQEWHVCVSIDWVVKERVERVVFVVIFHDQILLEDASVHNVRQIGEVVEMPGQRGQTEQTAGVAERIIRSGCSSTGLVLDLMGVRS